MPRTGPDSQSPKVRVANSILEILSGTHHPLESGVFRWAQQLVPTTHDNELFPDENTSTRCGDRGCFGKNSSVNLMDRRVYSSGKISLTGIFGTSCWVHLSSSSSKGRSLLTTHFQVSSNLQLHRNRREERKQRRSAPLPHRRKPFGFPPF